MRWVEQGHAGAVRRHRDEEEVQVGLGPVEDRSAGVDLDGHPAAGSHEANALEDVRVRIERRILGGRRIAAARRHRPAIGEAGRGRLVDEADVIPRGGHGDAEIGRDRLAALLVIAAHRDLQVDAGALDALDDAGALPGGEPRGPRVAQVDLGRVAPGAHGHDADADVIAVRERDGATDLVADALEERRISAERVRDRPGRAGGPAEEEVDVLVRVVEEPPREVDVGREAVTRAADLDGPDVELAAVRCRGAIDELPVDIRAVGDRSPEVEDAVQAEVFAGHLALDAARRGRGDERRGQRPQPHHGVGVYGTCGDGHQNADS